MASNDINVVDAPAFTGISAVTSHPPAQYISTTHPSGRFTTVVSINPAELPIHACRPARGLPQQRVRRVVSC